MISRPFCCPSCNELIVEESDLLGNKLLICPKCGKGFWDRVSSVFGKRFLLLNISDKIKEDGDPILDDLTKGLGSVSGGANDPNQV